MSPRIQHQGPVLSKLNPNTSALSARPQITAAKQNKTKHNCKILSRKEIYKCRVAAHLYNDLVDFFTLIKLDIFHYIPPHFNQILLQDTDINIHLQCSRVSYTMTCPPVCGDNPRAYVQVVKHVDYFIPPTSV